MPWYNLTNYQFVSYTDAKTSGISTKLTLPTSNQWMTKSDVNTYLKCDPAYLEWYANNQYVMKQDLKPYIDPVKLLFHFSSFSDNSTYSVPMTTFGSPYIVTEGKFDNRSFNGNYDRGLYFFFFFFISALSGDFTIDYWGKMDNPYGSYPYILSIGIDDGTINGFGFRVGWDKIQFGNYSEDPSNYLWAYFTESWYQWNHFAVTRESGYTRLFVNGNLKVGGYISWTYPNVNATIGGRQQNNNVNSWYTIDELRVTSRAEWTSNFTPPTSNYVV